jgi:sirohydrochlorin ferrochelatase
MTTLLVADGTRNLHGIKMIGDLAVAVAGTLDETVLAAAGTRDPHAQREVEAAAAMLSALVGSRAFIGFAAPCRDGSGYPSVPDAVTRARRTGASRVAVASYLLAEGLFQGRLREAGADVVAAPLGLHPAAIRLACSRRRHADVLAA